jgi:hypothetical protein
MTDEELLAHLSSFTQALAMGVVTPQGKVQALRALADRLDPTEDAAPRDPSTQRKDTLEEA